MSTAENPQPAKNPLVEEQAAQSVQTYFGNFYSRIRAGDLGPIPIILGLIIIAIIFQTQNSNFLTASNLVNLVRQGSGIALIAYGIVFVLLIGEIDLSVSYISAIGGVSMALLMASNGWEWYVAVPAALLVTSLIGFGQGLIITIFQVPAFVVTLGGFLAWNGMVLILMEGRGTVIVQAQEVNNLTNAFLTDTQGWVLAIISVGGFALWRWLDMQSRRRQRLPVPPIQILILQVAFLAVIAAAIVSVTSQDRGIPFAGVLLLIFLVLLTFIAEGTQFGRYVYAVGGNAEAARRAGIRVQRIRVAVFTLAGFMAGVGGIVLATRTRSVATNAGGGDLLLNSIAAAVIGGTSLFGGRGHVYNALLGALVIASVDNGMGLLGLSSGNKFVVTGVILVIAVIVDSFSRRQQRRSGLA